MRITLFFRRINVEVVGVMTGPCELNVVVLHPWARLSDRAADGGEVRVYGVL